jgi:hypothetical protein
MTRLALAALAAMLAASSAHAQLYQTTPTMGGGSYTIGPNGYLATTTPNVYGEPQNGTSTYVTPGSRPLTGDHIMHQLERGTSLDNDD